MGIHDGENLCELALSGFEGGNLHERLLTAGDEGRTSGGDLAAGFGVSDCLQCSEQRILFGARSSECPDVRQEAS